ncbi:LysM and BON domain-containing protein [Candidatus Fermentibacteria bacterium]|nr:LysM and BON domain-containing protein [Candidatus Fermentibacteria bacterium]
MGLFDFVKGSGQRLFGKSQGNKEQDEKEKSQKLAAMVTDLGFRVGSLYVAYSEGTATVAGVTQSLEDKEKIILAIGNTQGVDRVNDRLRVAGAKQKAAPIQPVMPNVEVVEPAEEIPEPTATFYTVESGDTLSKIAKAQYGNASKYQVIFEANRPMLTHPDKIYPGQVLRIPPLE